MKNFSMLSMFYLMFFLVACGSDPSTETEESQTISLETIKAAQPEAPKEAVTTEAVVDTEEATSEEITTSNEEELTEKSVPTVKEKTTIAKDRSEDVSEKSSKPKEKKTSRNKGIMQFSEKSYQFGTITEGEKVEHKFYFTNVGDVPINVKEASATCGCTYPSHPFVPIKPGEKSYIGVTFNSTGKEGKQRPKVTVVTDSDLGTFSLYLDGKVEKKETTEEAPKEGDKEEHN